MEFLAGVVFDYHNGFFVSSGGDGGWFGLGIANSGLSVRYLMVGL